MVSSLQPGGAAAKCGKLSPSDIILEVDGKKVEKNIEQVSAQLRGPVLPFTIPSLLFDLVFFLCMGAYV